MKLKMVTACSFGTSRATAPSMNFSRCPCMTEASFFPIALRRMSASPIVNPARSLAMRITCS